MRGQQADYTVTWSGRGSMPHQEADAIYWRTKQSFMDFAPDRIMPRLAGKGPVNRYVSCGCGRRAIGNGLCSVCKKKGRNVRKPRAA